MNERDGLSRNRANAATILIMVGGLGAVVVGTWSLLDQWWVEPAPARALVAPAAAADPGPLPEKPAPQAPPSAGRSNRATLVVATPESSGTNSGEAAALEAPPTPALEPAPVSSADSAVTVITPASGAAPSPVSTTLVTYQDGDVDVTPPTPIKPAFLDGLRPSSPGVRLDALTIAVTVNPDGSVESVKGLNAPQNISEYLLLSMALGWVKSWKFTPATKDGAPVKFRHVVPLRDLTAAQ